MPRIYRLLLAASVGVMVAGCDKSTNSDANVKQNTTYTGSKDSGHVFVLLRDQVSGAPLAQVKATLLGDSAIVKTTDSSGWLDFNGIGPGTRLLKVEKTGYAGRIVSVTLADGSSDVPRLMDVSVDLNLPRLGASATGKVYYTDRNGNDFPVIGDTLDVYLAAPAVGTWISGHSIVVSDSQGSYSVSGLPEDISIQITPRSVKMGITVLSTATKGSVSGLKSGESRFVPVFTLTANVEAFDLLSDNLSSVAISDSLVLTFSQQVDTNALRKGDIADSAGSDLVATTAVWSSGATKLTVRPFSGKWTSGSNSLHLNLKSTQGVAFSRTLPFTAGTVNALPGEAGQISYSTSYNGRDTSNVVNSNTGSVKFKWGRASGADGYDIYKKDRGDNSFVKVAGTSKGTDCEISLNTTDYFAKGDTVTFLVLATNAKGVASLSGAPTATLTDKIRPELSSAPGEFHLDPDLNNTSGTKVRDIGRVNFSFTEDMDTSMSASISFTNKDTVSFDASKLVMSWIWDSKSTGHVYLGVKTGKDATGLNAELSIGLSSFKDDNGNAFVNPLQADWLILVAK